MGWGSIIGGGLGAVGGFMVGGPVGAGVGMGLGAGLGGQVEDSLSSDEGGGGGAQTYQPAYVDPKYYDTAQYDSYLRDISQKEGVYDDRSGPVMDWEMANTDREMALQARSQQSAVAEEYRRAAAGLAPSVAEQQMRAGLAAANADALQVAASTRGGGGSILLAQRQAQQQGAASALATEQNAATLRAQETAAAREGWSRAVNAQRGQDLEMRGGSMAQTRAEADVALAARAQNDAMVRDAWAQRAAAIGGAANVNIAHGNAHLGAQTNAQNLSAQSAAAAAERAAAAANAKAARDAQMTGAMMSTGGQVAAMGMQAEEGDKNRAAALQAAGYGPAQPAGPSWESAWEQSGGGSYGDFKGSWGSSGSGNTYENGSGQSPAPGPDDPKKPGPYGGMGGDHDSSGDPYGYGYGYDDKP